MAVRWIGRARKRPRGVLALKRGQLTPVIQDATTAHRPLYRAFPFTRIERNP